MVTHSNRPDPEDKKRMMYCTDALLYQWLCHMLPPANVIFLVVFRLILQTLAMRPHSDP